MLCTIFSSPLIKKKKNQSHKETTTIAFLILCGKVVQKPDAVEYNYTVKTMQLSPSYILSKLKQNSQCLHHLAALNSSKTSLIWTTI